MTVNLLVFIHGITAEASPVSHLELYTRFLDAMKKHEPVLDTRRLVPVFVEWGNAFAGGPTTVDTKLSTAERAISELVRYKQVAKHPSQNNVVLSGPFGDPTVPGLRWLLTLIREQLVQFGLADAVYYASEEGEYDVRNAVYSQVLAALREFKAERDVRLHLISHSLGVVVAHDFLYGLFGSASPDFVQQAIRTEDREDFTYWKGKVGANELQVGSFTSMASQLPLFVLRKRKLVAQLAAGSPLDPRHIGIGRDGQVRWLIVYDVDDVLGFATRELYGNHSGIRQVQVDSGKNPVSAHTGYWHEARTIRETAALLEATCG